MTSPHYNWPRLLLVALIAAAVLLLAGCPNGDNEEIKVTVSDEGGGEARTAPADGDLLALARREGEVNWYTSITADQASGFARKFEAAYPGVRVRLVREGTFDLVDRVQREISAGQPRADVLHVLDPAIFVALRQRGELYYYEPPEASAVPVEYKDPGYWTGARLVTVGLACDPQRLKSAGLPVPERWDDLTHARWQGRLGLKDAQTAGSAYAQYYFLRELYGVAFWQRLAALKPRIYKTEENLLDAVGAGEILIAAGIMTGRLPDGAEERVQTVLPSDGIPLIIGPVAVLSRAPHLNAARLFVNYTLSQEGQAALRDLAGAYPTRTDVPAPKGWPELSTLPLLQPNAGWTEYLEKQGALRSEYTRLFHGDIE